MSVGVGKRDIQAIIKVLDQLDGSPEDCALAVWDEVVRLYESKAKYVVVGQLIDKNEKPVPGWEGRHVEDVTKLAIGPYGTFKQADDAATAMWWNRMTGEQYRTWAMRLDHHSSPFQYFKKRKAELDREALKKQGPNQAQRLSILWGNASPEDWMPPLPESKLCEHCGSVLDEPEEESSTGKEELS